MMRVTIYDTETGATVQHVCTYDNSFFWWSEGNGSCDCNRSLFSDAIHEEMIRRAGGPNICFQSKRFIIVDIDRDVIIDDAGDTITRDEALRRFNQYYPPDMVATAIAAYRADGLNNKGAS